MQNAVSKGETVTVPAPANVDSGEYVAIGALGGVAAGAAQTGEPLDLTTQGVFDITKNAAATFLVGDRVYFDVTAKEATDNESDSNSGGTIAIGVAVAVAGVGASTVRVRLTQPVSAA